MTLTKEQIIGANDLTKEEVDVPEWGGSVIVRTMTGTERDRFEATIIGKDQSNFRAALLSLCLIDDKGQRLFDNPVELGKKSAAILDRLLGVANRLNGIGKREEEVLLKN